jgi:biotin carboxylase/acetyl-CoA carboxylase carboxyltransferase component/biotin carboxyl carrier protein
MRRILIANRGLCALKFVMSMRDKYLTDEVCIVGLCAPDDITSDYKYLTQVDEVISTHNDIYMDIQGLVGICEKYAIDAVFPGWGYLSECSDFVSALEAAGIRFMGPTAKTIDMVGNKINSMDMAIAADVPLCDWSGTIPLVNREMVVEAVPRVGLPCVLKDADGGGGKGIRIIRKGDRDTIVTAYNQIIDEMKRTDGEACIFVMELMENCRHIEIQVVGDGVSAMHLFGRDCTTQRRNQKLIEEGPIIVAPDHIIRRCQDSSVRIARMVAYRGLGTVEFLYSPHNDSVTFLEINPRLQVEHIVTELLTDCNLPHTLYEITCNDKKLPEIFGRFPGCDIRYSSNDGWYNIELPYPKKYVVAARLNAEQPEAEFKPSAGKIDRIEIPNIPNSWSYVSMMNGGEIAGSVDSQFGHLFTVGDSREDACRKMIHLITHTCVTGDVYTTLSFIKNILCHDDFLQNRHTTLWVAHDMFDHAFKSSVLLSSSVPSISAWSLADQNTRVLTAEMAGLPIGLLAQGWFRLDEMIRETSDLIARGHIRALNKTVGVELEHDDVTISGTAELITAHPSNPSNGGWCDMRININSTTTSGSWDIIASICPRSDSMILVRFAESTSQFRVVIHNHDEKYDKFKMQIGNKTVAYHRPVVRGLVASPISGKVTSVFANSHHPANEPIIEIEAMKMIFPVKVELAGPYAIHVSVGDVIREDDTIAVMEGDAGTTDLQVVMTQTVDDIIGTLPEWLCRSRPRPPPPIRIPPPPRIPATSGVQRLIAAFHDSGVFRISNDISVDMSSDGWSDRGWVIGKNDTFMNLSDDDLFDAPRRGTGVAGFFVDGPSPCVLICHHPTYNHASMGVAEANAFLIASKFARARKVPRIYVCRTSGAALEYNVEVVDDIVSENTADGWIHRMTGHNIRKWGDRVVYADDTADPATDPATDAFDASAMYRVTKIRGGAVDTLNACAVIASETSLAYEEIPTFTYVRDYAVGIGAYLARLGHRTIQRRDKSPLLLTGFKALNQLLGQDLYISNDQLGGVDVMGRNGISQHVVDDDMAAATLLRTLVGVANRVPLGHIKNPVDWKSTADPDLAKIVDGGVWCETMKMYARSTLTGRAYIGGTPFALVIGNTDNTTTTQPVDPGNVLTSIQNTVHSGRVWYPDSAYKTAQTINDANREGLPLLVWVNWRGFSGGTRDMYDEILKFGSMIVDALRTYAQPVYVYLPPGAELRGGAMVVISSGINPRIRMWSDPSARVGILEPSGAYEVKFKKRAERTGNGYSATATTAAIDLFDVPETNDVMEVVAIGDLRARIRLEMGC